jgi:hypothetical protein
MRCCRCVAPKTLLNDNTSSTHSEEMVVLRPFSDSEIEWVFCACAMSDHNHGCKSRRTRHGSQDRIGKGLNSGDSGSEIGEFPNGVINGEAVDGCSQSPRRTRETGRNSGRRRVIADGVRVLSRLRHFAAFYLLCIRLPGTCSRRAVPTISSIGRQLTLERTEATCNLVRQSGCSVFIHATRICYTRDRNQHEITVDREQRLVSRLWMFCEALVERICF